MGTIVNYAIGILFILTSVFGYLSYELYATNALLKADRVELVLKLDTAISDINKAGQSCQSGQEVTKSVNQSINTLQEGMTKQLEGLAAITDSTIKDLTLNGSDEATGAYGPYVDNARLSPRLMLLLDAAYCNANKDDSSCATKLTTN